MKRILFFLLISTALFSSKILVENVILKCSKVKNTTARLTCFDKLASDIKPNNEEKFRAKVLMQSCTNCHGSRWDIPTKSGSRAVRHMTQKSIKKALTQYKTRNRDSSIMQNVMMSITSEEIRLISKYISKNVKETR